MTMACMCVFNRHIAKCIENFLSNPTSTKKFSPVFAFNLSVQINVKKTYRVKMQIHSMTVVGSYTQVTLLN